MIVTDAGRGAVDAAAFCARWMAGQASACERLQSERTRDVAAKSEFVARVRKIISSDQLAELSGVIEMLSESESGEEMKAFPYPHR
jgi:hypothetical protein